ncbi:nodulation protein NfeD, partial [Burkholderia pseudomallei]|nr:nodulation protein NfeD [Burkholderia pseudomallei]
GTNLGAASPVQLGIGGQAPAGGRREPAGGPRGGGGGGGPPPTNSDRTFGLNPSPSCSAAHARRTSRRVLANLAAIR